MGIIIVFLVGFGLTVSGGVTVIAYLNFLPAGVSWMEYLLFISTRVECYFFACRDHHHGTCYFSFSL
ncbi:hypothetical protein RWE15_19035 [Virgibacillus halophilus]|uniref:Uncharacterized protein n=1 Tax=Tigheibacillus halophilus TaxID=361280 RepID=A0ABU5C9S8_9BACI|nr:hypothetical protein [Virgibacillus halophilus]